MTSMKYTLRVAILATTAFWLAPATADLARVWLDDGTILRADATIVGEGLQLKNLAGEMLLPRERVAGVEWLAPAESDEVEYQRRAFALGEADVMGHFELARWALERELPQSAEQECLHVLAIEPGHAEATAMLEMLRGAAEAAAREADESSELVGVDPPPVLSAADIMRLKLAELDWNGPSERLNIRFLKERGQHDVEDLVAREINAMPDADPRWADTLRTGRPEEKLRVILEATGLKYADRIEIRNDPRAFATFKRRVLPLVQRGCLRSGCHGGAEAFVFRLPRGPRASDEYVYTSFAILDRIQTAAGPLIDRSLPEQSALLRYMLPSEKGSEVHPPVQKGRINPALWGLHDARYEALVEWVASLESPHPDYELDYAFPEWVSSPVETPTEEAEESAEPAMPGLPDDGEPRG